MACQWAPGICLSFLPLHWSSRYMASCPACMLVLGIWNQVFGFSGFHSRRFFSSDLQFCKVCADLLFLNSCFHGIGSALALLSCDFCIAPGLGMSLVLLTVSFSIKIIHTNIYLADLKFCGLRAVDIVAIVCQHSYFQPYQYITELFNLSFKVFFFTGFGVLPVASLGKVCSSSRTSALLPLPFPSVSFHVPVKKCLAWKTQRRKIYHGP